ncbi:phosphatase PAP2 family protein [Leucobacter luti]|uniref:PAP2 superfamily protein n=1 Tax=Leucobacter luti TaxID=340320 RepID=A0A4Q7TPF6_9MICO|nr:phosphatase PAP2 family protein [Leucobacter luti]MBL3699998.1 phosphatase PAP2 family protein [Leucobacter luti]RZT62686.1 PAP2 superfamily protein [Leucobacter luti]
MSRERDTRSLGAPSARRWWVTLACAVALFGAVYVAAVLTPAGQAFENAALRGADQVSAGEFALASDALGRITLISLAVATVGVGAIGLLRRQPALAAIAVGVIAAGQLVTQSLKRWVLPRPELVPVTGDFTENSFPSGHTTIAMTVLVAVFLVVPYRWRGIAMLFTSGWAVGIGAYTVTAKWHRLSDTIGADLVALALGAVAALILLRMRRLEIIARPPRARTAVVVVFAVLCAVSCALGALLATAALRYTLTDPVIEWDVYLSAHALALAGSLGAALAYWGTWHRIGVRPAPPRHE